MAGDGNNSHFLAVVFVIVYSLSCFLGAFFLVENLFVFLNIDIPNLCMTPETKLSIFQNSWI